MFVRVDRNLYTRYRVGSQEGIHGVEPFLLWGSLLLACWNCCQWGRLQCELGGWCRCHCFQCKAAEAITVECMWYMRMEEIMSPWYSIQEHTKVSPRRGSSQVLWSFHCEKRINITCTNPKINWTQKFGKFLVYQRKIGESWLFVNQRVQKTFYCTQLIPPAGKTGLTSSLSIVIDPDGDATLLRVLPKSARLSTRTSRRRHKAHVIYLRDAGWTHYFNNRRLSVNQDALPVVACC